MDSFKMRTRKRSLSDKRLDEKLIVQIQLSKVPKSDPESPQKKELKKDSKNVKSLRTSQVSASEKEKISK